MNVQFDRIGLATGLLIIGAALAACGGTASAGSTTSSEGEGQGTATETPATMETLAPDAATSGDEPLDLGSGRGLCALLPADLATEALGEPVEAGSATYSSFLDIAGCTYAAASGDAISIELDPTDTRAEWDKAMQSVGMSAETPVPGLGEAAYQSDDVVLGPGTRLAAFDGDHSIWVSIGKEGDQPRILGAAVDVARSLLVALD